jgi:hypothetical protein
MKKFALLVAISLSMPALAQQSGIPPIPLPANTVFGNPQPVTAFGSAIPLPQFLSLILPVSTCAANQFTIALSTNGIACAQPNFAGLAGSIGSGQIPANIITNGMLATATQNTVKGAATSTAETDLAVPSCSTASSALQWTTNTGFGCNALSGLWIHSKTFATGNGSTDDTTGLQNWINACKAVDICYLDPGTYKTSSVLTVNNCINILGAGRNLAILAPSNATQDTIDINTTCNFGSFQAFSIIPSVTKTGGSAISSTGSSSNLVWVYRDIQIAIDFIGITFVNSAIYTVDNVLITCTNTCISTAVTGDSTITNSVIQPAATNAIGVVIANGAGLRFVNNKINSVSTGSIGISWQGTNACTTCSDLVISGNSIEVVGNGIQFTKTTTPSFVNISITGNPDIAATNTIVMNDTTSGWLGTITISGNTLEPVGGTAITTAASVKNITIGNNTITGSSGATNGITIGTGTTGCIIGVNQFSGVITNFTDNSGTCRGMNGGALLGTTTNDNAIAGTLGEYVSATCGTASITNATQTNCTSISLTAGDWDVTGVIAYAPNNATTNMQDGFCSISLTSATLDQNTFNFARVAYGTSGIVPGLNVTNVIVCPIRRVSIATTTTVFVVAFVDFSVSTMNFNGGIEARRKR